MDKKRIVVVCPGRGSYTRETTNYITKRKSLEMLDWMDNQRLKKSLISISELDAMPFKSKIHMVGENASPLIYACSLFDFQNINKNNYDIVAIVGNSMGWYTALALAGAINLSNGYQLIETMGSLMKTNIIGGQIIYPIINDNWSIDNKLKKMVHNIIEAENAFVSIYLGGYVVIGGEVDVLERLIRLLPKKDKFPLLLPFHGAFHTPLMNSISKKALKIIDRAIFKKPVINLIDGRGKVWTPYSTNIDDLIDYTLNKQVVQPFDFTTTLTVCIKEFAPEKIFLLGPGNSLGGAVAQILIKNNWKGISSKERFKELQDKNSFVISMGA